MTRDYIIMWDCYGLESVVDISGKRQQATCAILSNGPCPDIPRLDFMMLRARMNPHRNYEIYALVTDDMEKDYIQSCFHLDSQHMVDLIRKKGTKLYSDRQTTSKVIV